jgi:uncharacterized protein (TIGR00255 family)
VIRSMTGFGRAEVERNGRVLVAEVRSVNHRFLELSARLPRGLQPHEDKLRAHLQEMLSRGKINLTVSWKGASEEGGVLSVNFDLAQRYVDILQELRAKFGFRDAVTLGQITSLPDVFVWNEPDLDGEEAWSLLRDGVDRAVKDLILMREAEGESLTREFTSRLERMRTAVASVESRAPERVREAKERMRQRVAEILKGEAELDEDRLLIEAAIQADRMDCTEECVRLRSHIDQFEALLREGGPVGRKFNFLTQEMNREANTIGSKANDASIARDTIQLKEEIEIVREQVQNIE